MIGPMRSDSVHQGTEEDKLDLAMTSIDPMLQASLRRDERRRRLKKWLFWGAGAMVATVALIVMLMPLAEPRNELSASATTRVTELSQEGWRLWQDGRHADAEQSFRAAIEIDKNNANTWNGLGWAQFGQQEYDAAEKSFGQALRCNAEHPAALNGLGQVQFLGGRLDAAEETFRRAADRAPAARFGLARVCLLLGKFADAETLTTELLSAETGELDRGLLEAMKQAAVAREVPASLADRLKPLMAAARAESKAPVRQGDVVRSRSLNAKGWQLFQAGDAAGAEQAFRQALEAQPSNDAAQNGLGFSLLNQGKATLAKPIFEELVKQNPKHLGFVNGLARSYMESGDVDRAIQIWRRVDQKNEVNAITWGLARALMQKGELREALTYWQRIDQSTPNNPLVQQMIAQCGG